VYSVTKAGRRAQRRWLDEPPAPPTLEFEGMIKVFFADGGSLEQLRGTLRSIAETADERLAEIEEKVAETTGDDPPFAERTHLNVLGLRFIRDHERTIATWARWALEQTEGWRSTTDPAGWDHRAALSSHRAGGTSR
jgi:hypothetical protein